MGWLGWIMAVVLVALMLPLWGIVYTDNLIRERRVDDAVKKLERIERQIERKERDKNRKDPDAFGDNPVFDRVRRPFQVPMSRPQELGKRGM